MNKERELARRFDTEGVEAAMRAAQTSEEKAYVTNLQRMREGVRAVADVPEISDIQFNAFMAGIREQIEAPQSRRGFWALLSLSTAALLVALSVFVVFMSDHGNSESKVEAATTNLQGATVNSYVTPDGNPVIWISTASRDVP
ncbi:MAG: hypothetical protein K1Y02_22015 [Candidatus Hydrogenedentes bacterium]|nr:hypothetical protein [Candidatus Hydrogenedentota bacterium]